MNGRIIVTGATGGIGSAVTAALAARGCSVVMACRNAAKAEALRAQLMADHPQARLEVRLLDLGSLASVRAFAEGLGEEPVAALLNNAGTISRHYGLTPDGLERTSCVNYIAPFLLTRMLLPRMAPDAHVVNMVSLSCRYVKVTEALLNPAEKDFSQLGTYARSKLALLHFSQELARRYPDLHVNLADPGVVDSGIISLGRWFDPLTDVIFRPLIKSPEKGAVPPLRALFSPERNRYFVGKGSRPIPERYRDPALEQRLWVATERLL